ncbi:Transposase, Ptta/En/Spm, plant [Corchorus olitorius]|uniref:Transposase, Ptta/En/Spm, plant n=1 Tax=Corchorus olitorius TaxID=93759 RepID=A0A1R3KAB3_9ROSI|nr:Transposase, Ptta/En/Spm, plant [Corchorus olitorius]
MKMPHTSGTISFARRARMEFDDTGKLPSRSKIYVKYHRHKDGKPVSDEAEENLNKIQAILDNQTTNGEFPEERVTPKMFERSNLQALKENEQMKEKNKKLEDKVDTLTTENEKLKDQFDGLMGEVAELRQMLLRNNRSQNNVMDSDETQP